MQEFKEALKILEESEVFKKWKKENPEAYLSYGFFVVDDTDFKWKIGYYHGDKITSFVVGDKIEIGEDEDVFQKEKKRVEGIVLDNLKLDIAEAVAIANQVQQEEYSAELPRKIIAIIQNLDKEQIWNVTFLTQSFKTLNIKIKSDNGEVTEKKLDALFQFEKGGAS